MADPFWTHVDSYLDLVAGVDTVGELIDITRDHFAADWDEASDGDAFYPGSGGRDLVERLEATWLIHYIEAPYWWVATDRNGDKLTYIEGDIYIGRRV